METEILHSQAQLLRQHRERFLKKFRSAEAQLANMAGEREIEPEEHAQEEQSALFLIRHDEIALAAVKEIDAALQRITDGTYGKCERCRKPISIRRLRSLPAARFCRGCALRDEHRPATAPVAFEAPAEASIPPGLNLLNDREMTDETVEHLKEDGRVDMHEVHLVCRKGVVYLTGKIPSEAEHQILLHTLTDVLAFEDIVDHLDVERLLWQTERRAKEPVPDAALQRWEDPPGTEDILEANEDDKEFVAPAKPTPDES